MNRTLVFLVGVVLCLGATSLPVDAKTGPCSPKHSVTIVANAQVRVYRDRAAMEDAVVFACHRATASRTALGSAVGDTLLEFGGRRAIALRGSTIAYGLIIDPDAEQGGPSTSVDRIRPPFSGSGSSHPAGITLTVSDSTRELAVEKILIAPTGTVLLAVCRARDVYRVYLGCSRSPGNVRIVAATNAAFAAKGPRTKPVVLANANGIDPRSLRLSPSGTHAGWTEQGRRRSARLPRDPDGPDTSQTPAVKNLGEPS